MNHLAITSATLHNEEAYTTAIEKLEKQTGKQIKEVVLKNMVLTVKKWKELKP